MNNKFNILGVLLLAIVLLNGCNNLTSQDEKVIPKEEIKVVESTDTDKPYAPTQEIIRVERSDIDSVNLSDFKDETNGFSFKYPSSLTKDKYTYDGELVNKTSFWTKEKYEMYKNPPETCELAEYRQFCYQPALQISLVQLEGNQDLGSYLLEALSLGESFNDEIKKFIEYSVIKVNDNQFIRVSAKDLIQTDYYFIEKDANTLISFNVTYLDDRYDLSDTELNLILSSLTF